MLLPSALVVAALLAGCTGSQSSTTQSPATQSSATLTPQSPGKVYWGYDGDTGPKHWGALSPEFALCATGTRQTPIDLASAVREDIPDVIFSYRPASLQVLNNGHTIQVPLDGASSITVGDTTYDLVQFHFHTPSEHTVDKASFDAELHLVHADANDRLAVVAVLIEEGADNTAAAPIIENLPAEADQRTQPDGVTLDPQALLPDNRLTFQYSGSLTTPPCSEDVSWYVMATPTQMSGTQLAALEAVMGHNNRPLQQVNDRELREDTVTR